MYFRKIRPSTTCLYSAASMLLRSLSAASHSLASKPRLAPLPLAVFAPRDLPLPAITPSPRKRWKLRQLDGRCNAPGEIAVGDRYDHARDAQNGQMTTKQQ